MIAKWVRAVFTRKKTTKLQTQELSVAKQEKESDEASEDSKTNRQELNHELQQLQRIFAKERQVMRGQKS